MINKIDELLEIYSMKSGIDMSFGHALKIFYGLIKACINYVICM